MSATARGFLGHVCVNLVGLARTNEPTLLVVTTRPVAKVRSFKDLIVWQRAIDLGVLAYRLSHQLPKEEKYALGDQMRRSAASIPANIAEGTGGRHTAEYVHSLSIADRSLRELETHLVFGVRLQYFKAPELEEPLRLIDEIGKMLNGLSKSLKAKLNQKAGEK